MMETKPHRYATQFPAYLWVILGVFFAFVIGFALYMDAENRVGYAEERRLHSFFLADELRQSSDDLTRMVRSYVVTHQLQYKQHYEEILDIRDGKAPRPMQYQSIYWDLVLENNQRPTPFGEMSPLLDLMRKAGFTMQELAKLEESKAASDALTHTEFEAMALIESQTASHADQDSAVRMLYDQVYHEEKAAIMKPIAEFYQMVNQRTLNQLHQAEVYVDVMRWVLILFGVILVFLLWRMRQALRQVLGGTVHELYGYISILGRGDFHRSIPYLESETESIKGWLSQMQRNLEQLDLQRRASSAEAQLYLNVVNVMMVVIGKDQRVVLANQKACNVLGYSESEIVGKNWFDHFIPQNDVAMVREVFDQILSGAVASVAFMAVNA